MLLATFSLSRVRPALPFVGENQFVDAFGQSGTDMDQARIEENQIGARSNRPQTVDRLMDAAAPTRSADSPHASRHLGIAAKTGCKSAAAD